MSTVPSGREQSERGSRGRGERLPSGRERSERGEHGSQLIEMVATVLLLAIVMVVLYQGITSTTNAAEGANLRLQNLDEARTLMAVTSKDVRTAVRLSAGTSPFVVADRNDVVFYANLDTTGAPKKVQISIDAQDQLIEQVWDADSGSTAPNYTYTGTPSVRFVGRYVDNDTANPIFTYLDEGGTPLVNYPLSAADRLAIKAVQIELIVKRGTTRPVNPTVLVNRVRLPNMDYNAVAG
jgi:type II secretory pathway pseudopilin PulG